MRVLGIDTATWTAGVGVTEDARVLVDRRAEATGSHVASLPGLVATTVSEAGLAVEDLDAIAVSAGPGSFTGLRIGVAFAKGVAFAAGIPLVGVPTLEAHACCAGLPAGTLVCVANDARKGELWAALFVACEGGAVERRWPDHAWRPAALVDALPRDAVVVGDAGALLGAEARGAERRRVALAPSGAVVARLGCAALARGERASVGGFEPTYVRAPDATLPSPPLR